VAIARDPEQDARGFTGWPYWAGFKGDHGVTSAQFIELALPCCRQPATVRRPRATRKSLVRFCKLAASWPPQYTAGNACGDFGSAVLRL
jgi:hypothetical protein